MTKRMAVVACLAIMGFCASAPAEDGIKVNGFDVIGIGGSGGIFTPTVHPDDPNILFVSCDMSGAYRSADNGKTWHLLHYKQISNCHTVRPTFSKDTMYWVRSPDMLLASKDKGATWSPVTNARPHSKGRSPTWRQVAVSSAAWLSAPPKAFGAPITAGRCQRSQTAPAVV